MIDKRSFNPKTGKFKSEFVTDYIIRFSEQANPIADKNGVTSSGGVQRMVKELPFKSGLDFYKEFLNYHIDEGFDPDKLPGKTTFCNVLADKKMRLPCELRLLRCKGAHASCEICVNASKLLENRSKNLSKRGKCKYFMIV